MVKTAAALHILVKREQEALDIEKKLERGADFATMAKKHSTCPSKKKGGDLGEFAKGDMVKPFDQAVFSSANDKQRFIGPVKTRFGYHIIKVLYKS
jgi:peptidyl-prolyl cis-trans isomerase C